MSSVKTRIQDDFRVVRAIARLMTAGADKRVSRLYEMYKSFTYNDVINDRTQYMNLGYWQPGCTTLDDASEAMVDLVADSAGFAPGDHILDVGFGYGDQSLRWAQTRAPAQIIGLDLTPLHVENAQRRARERGLDGVVSFRQGSGTELDFESESFDKVVALECAFHFRTREDFFHQAFKVLRPGGVLALADVLPLEVPGGGVTPPRSKDSISRTIDPANWYIESEYRQRLAKAGFEDVRVRSIRDEVLMPFRRHFAERIMDPSIEARGLNRLLLNSTRRQIRNDEMAEMPIDYVIVVAGKSA